MYMVSFISCEVFLVALFYVPVMVCCCGTGRTIVQYILLCSLGLASQAATQSVSQFHLHFSLLPL